jgi:hypothetical protein
MPLVMSSVYSIPSGRQSFAGRTIVERQFDLRLLDLTQRVSLSEQKANRRVVAEAWNFG